MVKVNKEAESVSHVSTDWNHTPPDVLILVLIQQRQHEAVGRPAFCSVRSHLCLRW